MKAKHHPLVGKIMGYVVAVSLLVLALVIAAKAGP